ncbi:NADPH-dependent FMN reductase [Paraliobacillus ryukyuensis]|uniref:NADPH-dependent FMN reductase n=1 Tax=Paraliobacillus ryukyuensis TaxID=200904 RepID=UPI0009A83670|nr:NADPH-dependent FMN reductase [Paraliobacillus ryukyuensis]
MKVVGVAGALAGWKTNVIVHHTLKALEKNDSNLKTELIDLRDVEVEFARGEPLAFYNDDTFDVVNKLLAADILVFGTPIYQASISGALKNLLDHLPVDAFKRKITGIVATGSIDRHALVPDYHLKPVLVYLKGTVPSTTVFVENSAFSDVNEILDERVVERMDQLAQEMLQLQQAGL